MAMTSEQLSELFAQADDNDRPVSVRNQATGEELHVSDVVFDSERDEVVIWVSA